MSSFYSLQTAMSRDICWVVRPPPISPPNAVACLPCCDFPPQPCHALPTLSLLASNRTPPAPQDTTGPEYLAMRVAFIRQLNDQLVAHFGDGRCA